VQLLPQHTHTRRPLPLPLPSPLPPRLLQGLDGLQESLNSLSTKFQLGVRQVVSTLNDVLPAEINPFLGIYDDEEEEQLWREEQAAAAKKRADLEESERVTSQRDVKKRLADHKAAGRSVSVGDERDEQEEEEEEEEDLSGLARLAFDDGIHRKRA
jgi:hypothetical protein